MAPGKRKAAQSKRLDSQAGPSKKPRVVRGSVRAGGSKNVDIVQQAPSEGWAASAAAEGGRVERPRMRSTRGTRESSTPRVVG